MKNRIRLLIADDHPIVRKGIASCLARQPSIQVVGEASDGVDAVQKTRELRPDVVLMDIDMPRMTGLAATEALSEFEPQVKVLILTIHADPDYVVRIMEAGGRGYVLKDASPEDLLDAIQTVYNGETFFSSKVARIAIGQFIQNKGPGEELTPRERQVLIHIAEGLSNKEIAVQLDVGVRTIETHRERIMRKLNIHSVAGLTKYAISRKLVTVR